MGTLATSSDLAARLGRPLTTEEQARAEALLTDASALVRSYTRQAFTCPPTVDTITIRSQGAEIRLPGRPVRSVEQVLAVSGLRGVADVPVVGWAWDGVDLIHVATAQVVINLPEVLRDSDWQPRTFRVTYAHGYDAVPADVVAVVCAMVLRTLTAPTTAGGVISETIGAYSYRLGDAADGGTAVTLTGADRSALARYRRTTGVTMTRY